MRRSTLPAPLTILGWRKDGRPIRVIAGGAEEQGQGGAGGNGGAAAGSTDQNGQGGAQTGTQGGAEQNGQGAPIDQITDPAELRAIITRQQHELANQGGKSREQARQAAAEDARKQLTQDIAKALGLANDDAKDPATLQQQITQLTEANVERDRELAVYRAALAPGMNVDAGRLLDSRAFMRSMADVDPTADDAHTAITDRIKRAVSSDPSLQLRQVSGGGSVGHAGGAGDHTQTDLSKLHGATLMEAAYAAEPSK